jgi:hypothetical protein
MEAGKDLDVAVATKLGWRRGKSYAILMPGNEDSNYWYNREGYKTECAVNDPFANHVAWSPSTDEGVAMKLVKGLTEQNPQLGFTLYKLMNGNWAANFSIDINNPDEAKEFQQTGSTPAHAISLAVLELSINEPQKYIYVGKRQRKD